MKWPGKENPSLEKPKMVAVAHIETPRLVAKPRPEVGASLKGARPSKLHARMVQKTVVHQVPTLAVCAWLSTIAGSIRLSIAACGFSKGAWLRQKR